MLADGRTPEPGGNDHPLGGQRTKQQVRDASDRLLHVVAADVAISGHGQQAQILPERALPQLGETRRKRALPDCRADGTMMVGNEPENAVDDVVIVPGLVGSANARGLVHGDNLGGKNRRELAHVKLLDR